MVKNRYLLEIQSLNKFNLCTWLLTGVTLTRHTPLPLTLQSCNILMVWVRKCEMNMYTNGLCCILWCYRCWEINSLLTRWSILGSDDSMTKSVCSLSALWAKKNEKIECFRQLWVKQTHRQTMWHIELLSEPKILTVTWEFGFLFEINMVVQN